MHIKLNGEYVDVKNNISLTDLLKGQQYKEHSFAVAINECFVPHNKYVDITLCEGDRVDVVVAMQGG